ncbi:hypothetical protein [Nocardia spumae]|uniref:hypothetical protein n=1 Tax=Nocardia spumae TaxID=2887190 RepID=UPI001D1500DB|nr:hypothetical protein [Nocardia spumae]
MLVNRIGFTAKIPDTQLVGEHIDNWVECFMSWLDLLTGQHVTTVGYRPPRQAMNRTCLYVREPDGSLTSEYVFRPFPPVYEDLGHVVATTELLEHSCALAGDNEQVPMAWTLLRDARALHRVTQTRRAAVECGSAVEMAAKALVDRRNITIKRPKPTLGTFLFALRDDDYPLPIDFESAVLDVRNREVHMLPGWGSVSKAESLRMLEIATILVEDAFPFPRGIKRVW